MIKSISKTNQKEGKTIDFPIELTSWTYYLQVFFIFCNIQLNSFIFLHLLHFILETFNKNLLQTMILSSPGKCVAQIFLYFFIIFPHNTPSGKICLSMRQKNTFIWDVLRWNESNGKLGWKSTMWWGWWKKLYVMSLGVKIESIKFTD